MLRDEHRSFVDEATWLCTCTEQVLWQGVCIVGRRHVINKETVEGAAGVYYDEYILKVQFVSCGVVFEPCASRVRGHRYIV